MAAALAAEDRHELKHECLDRKWELELESQRWKPPAGGGIFADGTTGR
jgi:hypothetical protein